MLIAAIVGLYGLIAGSFLNALIPRLHDGRTMGGRSACPHCKHQLKAVDLVPVLSWLVLGGRCRYCKKPIGWADPTVELATSLLWALSYAQLQPGGLAGWLNFAVWLYVLTSLIGLAVYDLRWYLLPNKILLPAIAVTAVWLAARFVFFGLPPQAFYMPFLAAIIGGLGFFILAIVAGGKLMGMGDVKLVVLMGLLLGARKDILALGLAFYSAAIIGLALIAAKKKTRKDHLPFGPFLVGGTIAAFLYGGTFINLYLHLSGLR